MRAEGLFIEIEKTPSARALTGLYKLDHKKLEFLGMQIFEPNCTQVWVAQRQHYIDSVQFAST